MSLKAPFPWFGGKSRCAHLVWERFGDVPNFVDPFSGSLAVPLGRPHAPRTETFNDKDCYVSNFWRAVTFDPEQVAQVADWPVNEADLHARHRWLVAQLEFREKMMSDPEYYDAKIAGRWVWGISQWIGSGWCSRPEWTGRSLPGRAPRGVNSDKWKSRPNLTRTRNITNSDQWKKRVALNRGGRGVTRKMPTFGRALDAGVLRTEFRPARKRPLLWHSEAGITKQSLRHPPRQLPAIGGDGSGAMRGVLRNTNSRRGQWKTRPFLSTPGNGVQSMAVRENLIEYMLALQDRLRFARICCGDWLRVLGTSPTTCIGLTGVFLDPPYSGDAGRDVSIYNAEDLQVAKEVAQWARENGDNPKLRIALCGYEGEHRMPKSWTCVAWKANGGYGNQASSRGRDNARRERIWFSPHCLMPQGVLL